MVQLHPPLSGMPLAFVLLLASLESLRALPAVSRRITAVRPLLVFAVVASTLFSFLSGYQASSDLGTLTSALEGELGTHHAVGRFLLINALLLGTFAWIQSIARRAQAMWSVAYYAFLATQLALTLWVGSLGGDLVFHHGFGVKAAEHEAPGATQPTQ